MNPTHLFAGLLYLAVLLFILTGLLYLGYMLGNSDGPSLSWKIRNRSWRATF